MIKTKTVAVYCRISKDPTGLEVGVDRQRADCLELAIRIWGDVPVRVFMDNDLSAADPAVERPGWLAMLDALRSGAVDEVVSYDQSRLTRQPIEWEQLLVVLGRRSIHSLHTVREGERDVGEGGGRMVSRIIAAVDAEYAEVTRIRVRRAMRQLAAEGRPNGGRVFGFLSAVGDDGRKTRVIVSHEADAVRWAAREVLQGETLAPIARAFDAQGLAHVKKGKTWSPTHVRNLVRNPAVAGLRPDPDGNLIPAVWPAILDATTWRNVRAALAQPVTLTRSDGRLYRTTRERRPLRRHLLTAGLAFCGVCRAPLSAQVRRRRSGDLFVSYICDPRVGRVCVGIVAHHLERCVVEALFVGLADPVMREALTGADPPVVAGVTASLDAVEGDSPCSPEGGASGRSAAWSGRLLVRVSPSVVRLRDRLGVLSVPALDATTVLDRWETMGLAGRRSVLSAVFERIEVHRAITTLYDPNRVKLVWRTPALAHP